MRLGDTAGRGGPGRVVVLAGADPGTHPSISTMGGVKMRAITTLVIVALLSGCATAAQFSSNPVERNCSSEAIRKNGTWNAVAALGILVGPVRTEMDYHDCIKNAKGGEVR